MKKERESKFNLNIALNETTYSNLESLSRQSYCSKTGIVRIAIDYLYYTSNNLPIPSDLLDVFEDLKNN